MTYFLKLFEGDFAVVVVVSLDDRAVDQLLQLHIVEVSANHHLEHGEELSVRDVAVVVNIVDLEGETEFLLLLSTS